MKRANLLDLTLSPKSSCLFVVMLDLLDTCKDEIKIDAFSLRPDLGKFLACTAVEMRSQPE